MNYTEKEGSLGGQFDNGFRHSAFDLGNPPSLAPMILATNFVSLGLALLAVSLRLWARIGILRKASAEDYLIAISLVLSTFMTYCACNSLTRGIGRHWVDIPPEIKFGVPKFPAQYVAAITYTIAGCLVKVSILLFYLRLNPNLLFRRACFIAMAFVIMTAIATLAPSIFACNPIDAMWNFQKRLEGGPGTCIDLIAFWNAGAAINCFSDLIVLILPLPMIYKSRLPFVQKVHALILFALGGFLFIVSIIRLVYTIQAGMDVTDFTWSGSRPLAWSSVEINVGIVVACIPAVRILLARVYPSFFAVSSPGLKHRRSPTPRTLAQKIGWRAGQKRPNFYGKGHGDEMTAFGSEVYDGRAIQDGYTASVISGATVIGESSEVLRPPVEEGVIAMCIEIDVKIESRRMSVESGYSESTWSSSKQTPV